MVPAAIECTQPIDDLNANINQAITEGNVLSVKCCCKHKKLWVLDKLIKSTLLSTPFCHQRLFLPGTNKGVGDRFRCSVAVRLKPLEGGGVFYIFQCQCQMRHQQIIVQWPPISLFLKSLGLDIYKTSPPSANRAVVQKL